MKKIFKKNQIIITALALMIAAAGYVSYTNGNLKDDKEVAQTSAEVLDKNMRFRMKISDWRQGIFLPIQKTEQRKPLQMRE